VSPGGAARAKNHAQSVTEISDDEFALFQSLICREAGIHLAASKKPMLISRLMRRVGALNLESFGDYYRHVINDRGEELIRLLDAVSTNETWFFRNAEAFAALTRLLHRSDKTLRLLSLPCSTGEEPYSIAITLMEPELERWTGTWLRK